MDKDFEYIELVFENCNGVKISPVYIKSLSLIDLRKHMIINFAGQFIEIEDCKEFLIMLKKEALKLKTDWEKDPGFGESFEDHIKLKDITHVCIKVNDTKEFYIGVPWKSDGNRQTNLLQVNTFEEGYIKISSSLDKS